jgi:hypothetical protein
MPVWGMLFMMHVLYHCNRRRNPGLENHMLRCLCAQLSAYFLQHSWHSKPCWMSLLAVPML